MIRRMGSALGADWGVKGHADLHWRMPSPKQMERLATAHAVGGNAPAARPVRPENDLPDEYWAALLNDAAADRGPPGPSIGALRLSEIPQHVLRMSCRRCVAPSRYRRPMRSGWPAPRRSGRMSDSGFWTTMPATHRPPRRGWLLALIRVVAGARRSALSESWMPGWRRNITLRPCRAATASL